MEFELLKEFDENSNFSCDSCVPKYSNCRPCISPDDCNPCSPCGGNCYLIDGQPCNPCAPG